MHSCQAQLPVSRGLASMKYVQLWSACLLPNHLQKLLLNA